MFYNKYCPTDESSLLYNKNKLHILNKLNTNQKIYLTEDFAFLLGQI